MPPGRWKGDADSLRQSPWRNARSRPNPNIRDTKCKVGSNRFSCEASCGFVDGQARTEVEIEDSVRIYVAVQKRTERAEILGSHRVGPAILAEHALDHQRVDVDEADLQQVQREH